MAANREDEHDSKVDPRSDDERKLSIARRQPLGYRSERHDSKRKERGEHRNAWCKDEQKLVHMPRNHVFLQQQLQHVSNRLKQAHRPNTVRPEPVLHPR